MPVTTRYQQRLAITKECTRQFEEAIANPCILQIVIDNLSAKDLVAIKQISKDYQLNDLIDYKLNKLHSDKMKFDETTKVIGDYLNKCNVRGWRNRVKAINEMMTYICENKWFVDKHTLFADTIHRKMFQFIHEQRTFKENGVKYLGILFDLKPPKDYYNSKLGVSQYGMFDKNGKFKQLEK